MLIPAIIITSYTFIFWKLITILDSCSMVLLLMLHKFKPCFEVVTTNITFEIYNSVICAIICQWFFTSIRSSSCTYQQLLRKLQLPFEKFLHFLFEGCSVFLWFIKFQYPSKFNICYDLEKPSFCFWYFHLVGVLWVLNHFITFIQEGCKTFKATIIQAFQKPVQPSLHVCIVLSLVCPSFVSAWATPPPLLRSAALCRVHHVQGSHYSLGQSKAVVTLCQLR